MAAGVGVAAGAEVVAGPACIMKSSLKRSGFGKTTIADIRHTASRMCLVWEYTAKVKENLAQCIASGVRHMQLSTSELGAALAEAAAGCSSFLAAPAGAFLGCNTASV